MAQNTDLNVSPYYDDYSESKSFHRILFRPANAIQARELTQLQSILQNQVERFGNHIFQEGSLVMGGTITVNKEYYSVKVNDANPNSSGTATAETFRTAAVGKYYQGKTSGTVGKCINTAAKTSSGDPLTLFFTYVKSGNPSGTTYYSTFTDNEEIEEVSVDAAGTYDNAGNSNNEFKTIETNATFTGSAATVRSGVFYTRGFFVKCEEQTILLDKYANAPTYRIGLLISESLISSTDDDSLLDNASGTTNENAPGANRLKIALTLVKKAVGGTQDIDNFIELSRVEAGIITKQVEVTAYATLEKTLARRTHDESGDYVVKPFQLELRQHLNSRDNNGVFLSSNTVTPGDASKFVSIISPGKAYVKGFEVDKPSQSLITISKARTTEDAGSLAVPFEIGNYFHVDSVYGQPEFGTGANITPYGIVDLYTEKKTGLTEGEEFDQADFDPADLGLLIGKARVRYFNCTTPDVGSGVHTAASVHRIYLFDVRMFTKIAIQSGQHGSYALTAGQRVKGTVSGAKATVAVSAAAGGETVWLMDVEGTFSTSDVIRKENDSSGGKTIGTGSITVYSSDRVRSLYQAPGTANSANFTADTVTTDSQYVLTGTVIGASGDPTQTGVNTKFSQELKEGDVIIAPSGTEKIVLSITSDTSIELTGNGVAENGKYLRQRARLMEPEKTVAISPTPKDYVSSMTPNSMVIRKQAISQLNGSGVGTIAGVSNEVLLAEDPNDYMVTIMESAEGSDADEGDIVDISLTGVGGGNPVAVAGGDAGAITFTAADSTPMSNSDKLKVIYGATKSDVSTAAKTLNKSRGVKVTTDDTAEYGTNYKDEIITLGVPDVYALKAVYESNDTTDALPPMLTLASGMGACNPGDKITGSVTGAVGRVIQKSSNNIYFYYLSDTTFTTSDVVKNENSTDSATNSRQCTTITIDSKDITGNYVLDDGQRDGYYGLASIKRRAGAPTPQATLLIIFDYFTSGGGSFHTVNSYGGMSWGSIPNYIPNVIDPFGTEPDGQIELADAVDFRSYVDSLHSVGTFDVASQTNVSSISAGVYPLAYGTTGFATSSAVFDLPQSETSLSTTAMVHYLPRVDKISLSSDGGFITTTGTPADQPAPPTTPTNSILLHTLAIPPYTVDLGHIGVTTEDHKRFTMKDIGRIQGRVRNLERVTSFNALEMQTNMENIKDADGLDRFKSGFVTDNFRGHKVGNVDHIDYKIGVDRTVGQLRPQHNTKFVDISLNASSSSGYTKTGDLVTLPFTETPYVTIDKASTTEFVNPYDVVLFNGTVTLSPSKDMWFDSERLPSVRRTVEGDYDTVLKGVENALGTIWNNWQTDWVGEPVVTTDVSRRRLFGAAARARRPMVERGPVRERLNNRGRRERRGGGGNRRRDWDEE